jgi:phosphatidylethanolamine/phosphatidyl-N-methylethanolamine N-methyltransferase
LAFADHLRFLARLAANPQRVGAIAPSSAVLARAMAAEVDPTLPGSVLELGPGTGAITQALIDRGFAPERIVAVEYEAEFAALVRRRCPGVHVIQGDAFDLEHVLTHEAPFLAAVSGLPLVNFPKALRHRLIESVFARLVPGAPFVQFSYSLWPPVPATAQYTMIWTRLVLRNLPPARVWVYRRL